MARYDIYPSFVGKGFLLDVQTDLLDGLATRTVVPLRPVYSDTKLIKRLNPIFTIDGERFALFTHLIVSVPATQLREPKTNAMNRHDDIRAALDMLFLGF